MKNTNLTRAAASLLACGMVFGLTACSSSASSSVRSLFLTSDFLIGLGARLSNRRERSFQRSCQ